MTDDLDTLRPEVRGLGPCKMCGASGYSLSYGGPDICPACDCGTDPEVTRLKRELVEMKQTFDLRWKADMHAIKQWRVAHPGNDLVMPDHADMCVWLMSELATAQNTINAQQDTMGALKRKLALAEAELAALKARMKPCARVVGGEVRAFMDPDDEGKYVAVVVVEE